MSVVYFDESLFKYAELYDTFDRVTVFNRADLYLCKRKLTNIPISYKLSNDFALMNNERIANINPPKLFAGTNIYTLDSINKRINKSESYNQIAVVLTNTEDDVSKAAIPISLDEFKLNTIYTTSGELEPIESAIMIKYYAVNNADVQITKMLMKTIKPFFNRDRRGWFKVDTTGIVQNEYGELTLNGEILNTPINNFSSDEILAL